MEDAYTKKIRYMEHPRTHMLTCKENVLQEFVANVIGEENDNTSQNNTGSEWTSLSDKHGDNIIYKFNINFII